MGETGKSSRRNFIKQASVAGAAALAIPSALDGFPIASDDEGNGFTFLFQGDSITDGNRSRNTDWNHVLGHGYAYLIAARLWFELPKKGFHFFNRGISGNTVPDLAARWTDDTIA
ncbi:MAG: twin-arginine translocation signal domain-containing protein, partial [Mucilaginibacter sp.]